SDTSPADRPCTRICVGVTTMASATESSVTETRLSRSVVLINSDLPTMTRKGAAPCAAACGAWELASGPGAWVAGAWVESGAADPPGGCGETAIDAVSRTNTDSTHRTLGLGFTLCSSHLREQIDMSSSSECLLFLELGDVFFGSFDYFDRIARWHCGHGNRGGALNRLRPRRGGNVHGRGDAFVQRPRVHRGQFLLLGVQRVAQRQLNLALRGGQGEFLGIVGRHQ